MKSTASNKMSAAMAAAEQQFMQLAARGYQRIPVMRSLFADLDTPVSTYLKVGNVPYSYLLESVQGGDKWGRYSFIGLPAKKVLKVNKHQITEISFGAGGTGDRGHGDSDAGGKSRTFAVEDPLDYIREQGRRFSIPPEMLELPQLRELPRFCGGLVGYFAYECAAYAEPRLHHLLDKDEGVGCPHMVLMHSDDIIAFDNLLGKMVLISYADLGATGGVASDGSAEVTAAADAAYSKAQARLDEMEQLLASPLPSALAEPLAVHGNDNDDKLRRLLSAESKGQGDNYRTMVRRVKEYVRAGDAMQVVPSQRMEIDYGGDGFDFYRALRTVNPAPYMFYLQLDDFVVTGASPEILSRLEYSYGSQVAAGDAAGSSSDSGSDTAAGAAGSAPEIKRIATIRPIAGTRPRGRDKNHDKLLEQDMLNDPKEIAEHLMLIDLGRNDLGKVAKSGSVVVDDTFGIEKYSHVMHIVSNVTGELKDELDALDLLKSSLPAGTLSGAPKIRAMEIIAELEGSQRGIYGGALGYLGWQGNMDMCIGIRTAVIKDGKLFLQAGGGIVADSDEDTEWQETLNKRGALLRVANMLGLATTDDA